LGRLATSSGTVPGSYLKVAVESSEDGGGSHEQAGEAKGYQSQGKKGDRSAGEEARLLLHFSVVDGCEKGCSVRERMQWVTRSLGAGARCICDRNSIIALTTDNRRNGDVGKVGMTCWGGMFAAAGERCGVCGSESRGCVKIAFVAVKGAQEALQPAIVGANGDGGTTAGIAGNI
jgi:hypothetical protein